MASLLIDLLISNYSQDYLLGIGGAGTLLDVTLHHRLEHELSSQPRSLELQGLTS